MVASLAHVFAMKARAVRTRDIDDLRLLADIIGLNSAEEALRICAEFYPDEPVSPDRLPCSLSFSADDLLTPTIPRRAPASRRKPWSHCGSSASRHPSEPAWDFTSTRPSPDAMAYECPC